MKFIILIASVLMQVCLGGLYAWSTFVPALRSTYGLSTAQTQFIFGGLIAVFTLAMVYAGRLLSRRGPVLVAGAGAVLFGSGYLVASFSGGSFPVLLLGISLMAGAGTGFCYVCPVAMCVQWFPRHKGLATGVAVAGFGGGAVLLSGIAEYLFAQGMDVLMIFRWVGVAYGIAVLAGALTLRFPPNYEGKRNLPVPAVGSLLRDGSFWGLFTGMFAGTFAGLLVIGNLKPLALSVGLEPTAGAAAISAFALGNASGRITWGWMADRVGGRAVSLSLAFLAGSLLLLGTLPAGPISFVPVAALIGFGFGACFVVYAAQVGSVYGPERVGSVYPLVFLAYGASGIAGPLAGGWLFDATTSYSPAIVVSLITVVAGVVMSSGLLRYGVAGRTAEEPAAVSG